MLYKQQQRKRRQKRVRAKIKGAPDRPRLCVFRSNTYLYAQLIDDTKHIIIAAVRGPKSSKGAGEVGKAIAQKAEEKKITKAVFDRAGYKYHGMIKALAEAARGEGLSF